MEGCGHGRAYAETLHDAGELRVRLFRADDAEHGPAGTFRRDTSCGRWLSSQPGRLLGLLRRRLADALQQGASGRRLSHARIRSRLPAAGHSPRRPVGLPGIDGHQAGEYSGIPDREKGDGGGQCLRFPQWGTHDDDGSHGKGEDRFDSSRRFLAASLFAVL